MPPPNEPNPRLRRLQYCSQLPDLAHNVSLSWVAAAAAVSFG